MYKDSKDKQKNIGKGLSEYLKGGKITDKISKLIDEGYSRDQAIAIAINMLENRYPDGGEQTTATVSDTTSTAIDSTEVVIPGSARHKELQAQEAQYQAYLKNKEKYAPMANQFGAPKVMSVDEFTKAYPDADTSFIPKGTTTVFGYTADSGEGGFDNTPAAPIYAKSTSGSSAINFFPGYEEVSAPTAYQLDTSQQQDTSTEQQSQTTEPTKTFIKQKPGAWYKDAQGNSVLAPKDAIWRPEDGTYYDPKTGRIFNPYTHGNEPSVTMDPNFVAPSEESQPAYEPSTGTMSTPDSDPSFKDGGKFSDDDYKSLGEALRKVFGKEVFKDGGEKKEVSVEKLLTGEVVKGLDNNKNIAPNAEIEDKEFVKFPDGVTQKGIGETHENGGIEMNLPDGTKVLSDNRTLTKEQADNLRKEYKIKVSTKTTYAEALDKYVNKIGLRKLYDEQEDLFKELDKVINDSMSDGSSRINKEYLSKKIYNIEKQKEEKEKLKSSLFDSMFTMQEVAKRKDEEGEIEQFFKDGGISREAFRTVVNKYGLSEREGMELYKGHTPARIKNKYLDGGDHKEPKTLEEVQQMYEAGEITREQADRYEVELAKIDKKKPITFTTSSGQHEFSNTETYTREKQKAGEAAFGKITKESLPILLNNLYRNFPDIVAEEYGVVYNDDGTISFDDSINFSKASKKVKNFQERAQKRMEDTANVILKNPDSFSPEYVKSAEEYLNNETFDNSLARGIDSKLGNFTSGRYSLGIDVVTPEEKAELESKGIFTTKQLQSAIDSGKVKISETSMNRLENLRNLTPEGSDADFTINQISPQRPSKGEQIETTVAAEKPDPTKGIVDDITVPDKQYPKIFATPDQTPLPPSSMEAHLLGNIRLQRIDPTRIGVETELQQASDAIKEGVAALDHLPPNQRAAAIVAIQANAQKGINEAIHKANIVNAQNQASAELFNIGQAAQEQQARVNNLLSFESRQLTAKAKTEEEVRNYYDQLNRIAVNNFRNQQDLNMLQTLTPDYSLSPSGMSIDFTPEGEFKLQDNSKYKDLFG